MEEYYTCSCFNLSSTSSTDLFHRVEEKDAFLGMRDTTNIKKLSS